MNRLEHLLTQIGEECNEIGQRASKAARFGLFEVQPGQEQDNLLRMMTEFADLCGTIELLYEEEVLGPNKCEHIDHTVSRLRPLIDEKKRKIEKYLQYAAQVGTLK